jgi:hypoxanthine phosphoribosyltransferase
MTIEKSLADVLPGADLIHDRATLQQAITRMAGQMRADYAGERPLFLTVMHGGMIFASLLALELGFDVEFDYLHATRYRGKTSGGGLQWLRHPNVPMIGRRVLLVDDILDEGHTLAAVRKACLAEGAADVRIAVLTRKDHDRCVPGMVADYVGVDVPDRYVFGFGMDYHEQGRNLPGVYAL